MAVLLAAALSGCAHGPASGIHPAAPDHVCTSTTFFLARTGWQLQKPDAPSEVLYFLPGASFVTLDMELPFRPGYQPDFTFLNGTLSFSARGYAAANPAFPFEILVQPPLGINVHGPKLLSPGTEFDWKFNYTVISGSSSHRANVTTVDVSSYYMDPNPQGVVGIRTHDAEHPTYLQFGYCPPEAT